MALGHWLKDYIGPHEEGGGGDAGYECTETRTTLTEESVTTVAQGAFNMAPLSYLTPITAETIVVTFDGEEYECEKTGTGAYGDFGDSGPDFSVYPFAIMPTPSGNSIFTETAGTYSVKIEALEETVETTDCFKKAVLSASALMLDAVQGFTFNEAYNAFKSGRLIYLSLPPIGSYSEICPVVAVGMDDKNGTYYVKALSFSSASATTPSALTYTASSPTDIMTSN